MTKGTTLGSIIVGMGALGLLGWSIGQSITRNLVESTPLTMYGPLVFLALVGLFLAIKRPVFAEVLSYGIAVLIVFQFFWDYGANDLNQWRWIMFFGAVALFGVNLFSGKIKVGGGKRVVRKQLGF